jgi:hypothetical protein
VETDKRWMVLFGPAILAAEDNAIAPCKRKVPDRELMQGRVEQMLFDDVAGAEIEIDERRLHFRNVQFL